MIDVHNTYAILDTIVLPAISLGALAYVVYLGIEIIKQKNEERKEDHEA